MSTYVVGYKPPDEQYYRMKAVWDACKAAGVEPPRDVDDFFDGEEPDPAGIEVKLPSREWRNDVAEGIEVDVESLPAGVKTIRFCNSW